MNVIGIAMVKDELDILPDTITHMLKQVDTIIVFDDHSTDGTRKWLENSDVHVINNVLDSGDNDSYLVPLTKNGYYQSKKMTALAKYAYHRFEADWIVPFDADELWTSQWGTIKEVCEQNSDTYGLIKAELYDHMATGFDNDFLGSPVDRMPWRRRIPLPLPKVAGRADLHMKIEQGNHWISYSIPARVTEESPIVVHHYPYRSHEQFIKKVRNGGAAYASTNLPETMGAHWRQWNKFTDEQLIELFDTYYYVETPNEYYMINNECQQPLYEDPFKVEL